MSTLEARWEVTLNNITYIFDSQDKELLRAVGWTAHTGRVMLCTKPTYTIFSRYILEAPKHLSVDHINGNSADNRRLNLRLCTHAANMRNSKIRSHKKKDLPKGVYEKNGRYTAKITYDYRVIKLGGFATVEEADAAYKAAAEKYFGEYALHLSRRVT